MIGARSFWQPGGLLDYPQHLKPWVEMDRVLDTLFHERQATSNGKYPVLTHGPNPFHHVNGFTPRLLEGGSVCCLIDPPNERTETHTCIQIRTHNEVYHEWIVHECFLKRFSC